MANNIGEAMKKEILEAIDASTSALEQKMDTQFKEVFEAIQTSSSTLEQKIGKRFEKMEERMEERFEDVFEIVNFIKDNVLMREEAATKNDLTQTKNELTTHIDGVVGLFHRLDTEYVALCSHVNRLEAAM